MLLESDVVSVYINIKGVLDKIAEILNDKTVYLAGSDIIPEGKEKEVIEKLLSK